MMITEDELDRLTTKNIEGKTLLELYKDYCEELNQYDDKFYPEGQDERVFSDYEETEGVNISKIDKGGKHIGFLITLEKSKNELFICEAYVLPEYRRHGYMREAVKDALRSRKCMIRFMVFRDNPALKFWEKMMQEAGYRRVARQEHTPCLFEYFYWKD